MTNVLILHATANNSKGNWYSWLKNELEKIGWKVWLPDLPHSEKPNTESYNKFIFSNENWEFNDETIIIGHSSGAVAALHMLQHLPDAVSIDTCYLISAFKNDLNWPELKELFIEELDFEKIKKHAKKFVFIHSDNDPYCPLEHAQYLSEKLRGELIVLPGQGHFNLEGNPSYKSFPELLAIIRNSS